MSSKLFAFSRPLPAPFDKAKKKVKVSSKYGDGTEATLCSTVVKAVQAYFKCKDGSAPGAVGLCGTKGVAEYKSASGPEVYHLAIYDPAGGAMLASIYNKDTEMLETYAVRNNGQDGAAIMMSMLPALMADDEWVRRRSAWPSYVTMLTVASMTVPARRICRPVLTAPAM